MNISLKKLKKWEEKIRQDLAKGKYEEVPNMQKVKREYKKIFESAIKKEEQSAKKDKKITLRISRADLELIKGKASELDIPYQTLIRLIIKEYAQGKIYLKL